jgi:GxxExxY protein
MPTPPASLTKEIIGCFYEVYRVLGFGHLESVYTRALVVELGHAGLRSEREKPFEIEYRGVPVGTYRADLIVEQSVVVETKAGARIDPTCTPQLLNYLKACRLELGLVLYFGPRPTVKRVILSREQH